MFGRQRPPHVHEVAQGQAHAGHGAGQVVYLSRIAESGPSLAGSQEMLDPPRPPRSVHQQGGRAPRRQPDDGQQQGASRHMPS